MAFQEGCRKAKPVLLEPIMDVEVVLPEEYLGDVMNDLRIRRATIKGINSRPDGQVLSAFVPLVEMFGYATRLRSLSQGRASILCSLPNMRRFRNHLPRRWNMLNFRSL